MSLLQSVFLGFVQGVTEFLPISSSGHLAIFQNLFHMTVSENDDLLFDVLLHFGTLIAVFVVYWRDIRAMASEVFAMLHPGKRTPTTGERLSRRMVLLIIVGTLPLIGAVIWKDAVAQLYHNTFFIGFALIITGLMLYFSDRFSSGERNLKDMTLSDALLIGVGQMVAVVPGLSRAGTTISVALFRDFDREFAVKFSFLLSIPAVLGANLLTLIDAIREGIDLRLLPICLVGMLSAAVFGYFAIRLIRRLALRGRFGAFAFYCWGAGVLTLFLSLIS